MPKIAIRDLVDSVSELAQTDSSSKLTSSVMAELKRALQTRERSILPLSVEVVSGVNIDGSLGVSGTSIISGNLVDEFSDSVISSIGGGNLGSVNINIQGGVAIDGVEPRNHRHTGDDGSKKIPLGAIEGVSGSSYIAQGTLNVGIDNVQITGIKFSGAGTWSPTGSLPSPVSGIALIGTEKFSYSGIIPATGGFGSGEFTNVVRGVLSTTPTAHSAFDILFNIDGLTVREWDQHNHSDDGSGQIRKEGMQNGVISERTASPNIFGPSSADFYKISTDNDLFNRYIGDNAPFSMGKVDNNTPLAWGQFIDPFKMFTLAESAPATIGFRKEDATYISNVGSGIHCRGKREFGALAADAVFNSTQSDGRTVTLMIEPQPLADSTEKTFDSDRNNTYYGARLSYKKDANRSEINDDEAVSKGVRFQAMIPGLANGVKIHLLWGFRSSSGTEADDLTSKNLGEETLVLDTQLSAIPISSQGASTSYSFDTSYDLMKGSPTTLTDYGVSRKIALNETGAYLDNGIPTNNVVDTRSGCIYTTTLGGLSRPLPSTSHGVNDSITPWLMGCRIRMASPGEQGSTMATKAHDLTIMGAWITYSY